MFTPKNNYSYDDLIECAHGNLFGEGNCRLPLPPMLMVDEITSIKDSGGLFDKGEVIAEYNITPQRWFFECHFHNDPVMPGCLGLDAMWQLTGFFLGWCKHPGLGRALGVGDVKFKNMITPDTKKITYKINIKKIVTRRLIMAVSDGILEADGEEIYFANDMKVALFKKEG